MDRASFAYAACYCEENVWHLARDPRVGEPRRVVFISNASLQCAVWRQRSALDPSEPVIWDYHVVLLVGLGAASTIWDLDTTLSFPCPASEYLRESFPRAGHIPSRMEPNFRIVSAEDYVANFSSDRSHMRNAEGHWQALPPKWDPIQATSTSMSLMRFVDMRDAFVGRVVDLPTLSAELAP